MGDGVQVETGGWTVWRRVWAATHLFEAALGEKHPLLAHPLTGLGESLVPRYMSPFTDHGVYQRWIVQAR